MARGLHKLTAAEVKAIDKLGRYGDGGGLWLQVSRWGTKAWLFRYMLHGNARQMGLGSLNDFSLKEARERAHKARQLVADGIDPIDAKGVTRTFNAEAKETVVAELHRIIRRGELKSFTGYSLSVIYEMIAAGEFPKPIPLGDRAVGWLADEVAEWQAKCIAERDAGKPRPIVGEPLTALESPSRH